MVMVLMFPARPRLPSGDRLRDVPILTRKTWLQKINCARCGSALQSLAAVPPCRAAGKTPMIDSTPLSDLFQRWRQLRDQGQPTPPEQLCPDRPELVLPLREKIDAFLAQPFDGSTDVVTRPNTPPAG